MTLMVPLIESKVLYGTLTGDGQVSSSDQSPEEPAAVDSEFSPRSGS